MNEGILYELVSDSSYRALLVIGRSDYVVLLGMLVVGVGINGFSVIKYSYPAKHVVTYCTHIAYRLFL